MRGRRPPLALLLALALLGAGAAEGAPTVILLSWDGVRHDFPGRVDAPALERIRREGARAERLIPVYPSNTFPGHVSLATGTHPDRHGIVDNRFLDRRRGAFRMSNDASWIQAEPLWVAAERQGVPAAVFFWVGSETDWRGVGARHRVTPFDGRVPEREKVERILAWLDLPEPERPRLVMAWWHGTDRVGHRHGPDDPRVAEALSAQAAELARLLEGLDARGAWDDTTLLVVSDHGMTRVRGEVAVRDAVADSGVAARVTGGSSVAHVFAEDPSERGALLEALRELPHARALPREGLPASLRLCHPTRTGDVVVLADPGYVIRDGGWRHRAWRTLQGWLGNHTGIHGFAPSHPDMGGILLALGRGVPRGVALPPVRMIDVAPTVAGLLGIEPPRHAEGRPIGALLEPGAGAARGPAPQRSTGSPMCFSYTRSRSASRAGSSAASMRGSESP